MVRSDRNWPDIYFGAPGSLIKLPYPRGDMDKSYERQVYDFATGSGNHLVSTMLGGSRAYTLNWNALHLDTYSKLSQFWTGQMGYGPWVLVDPSMPNMLLPNQAATTNYSYDTDGFTTQSNLAVLSSNQSSVRHRAGATRNLQWLFNQTTGTYTSATPVLTLTSPYKNWYGIPVQPGLPYTFSGWFCAPTGSPQVAPKIRFYSQNGGLQAEYLGTPITLTNPWQQFSITQTPATFSLYMEVDLYAVGTSIVQNQAVYVDELVLEQDTVVNSWAPGTGVRPMEITALNDPVTFNARFRKGVTMALRELG